MPCIALWNAWCTSEPLGGIYISASSMHSGDQFDPIVDITHLEFSTKISKMLHKCRIV